MTGASAAQPYKVMPRGAAWTPQAAAFSPSEGGYASSSTALTASAASLAGTTTSKAAAAKTTSSKQSSAKASTKSSAKSTTAKTTSTKSAASNELAFLDDPTLSIQDKLYQFMALQMKKSNSELKAAMQEYAGKRAQAVAKPKASTSGSSGGSGSSAAPAKKSSGGGGLFGMLGDALGGIADAVVGGAESLAKDLGGPLLAAGCTAVGLPFLAPVALQIGGTIGKAAVGGVASLIGDTASSLFGGSSLGSDDALLPGSDASSGSTSTGGGTSTGTASSALKASTTATKASTTATKASTSTSKATASDGEDFDERVEAMNLQRLVEKQQAMFGILSNALKSMHDTQMNAIQNLR
ncbi:MAG TPA: hypothetical protein VF341_09580 [Anaeromyxobacteraceae bacterium]